MSYRIRFTLPDGRTGLWDHEYQTRETAQAAIDDRLGDTGFAYAVEEVASPEPKPEPMTTKSYGIRCTGPSGSTFLFRDVYATRCLANEIRDSVERWSGGCFKYTVEEIHDASAHGSTAAHHVEILRKRVKELEGLVEERGKAVTDAHVANHAMHQDLSFAMHFGDAMREAMRTGEWRAGHDRSMANSATSGWDRWKASLAASHQGTAKASEAPGEGGDSDRRRLEALREFLDGNEDASLTWWEGEFYAVAEDVVITAPTLAALADKLMEKEAKP